MLQDDWALSATFKMCSQEYIQYACGHIHKTYINHCDVKKSGKKCEGTKESLPMTTTAQCSDCTRGRKAETNVGDEQRLA